MLTQSEKANSVLNFLRQSTSIRASLDHLTQAFKLANCPDPRMDRNGRFALFYNDNLKVG